LFFVDHFLSTFWFFSKYSNLLCFISKAFHVPKTACSISWTCHQNITTLIELNIMNCFLMELKGINPERLVFVFALAHIRKIHFPQIDFSGVCSSDDKAFLVDWKGIDMFIFRTYSKVFWSQLKHVDFGILRAVWTLTWWTSCIMICNSPWLCSSLEMSFPCSPRDLIILFLNSSSHRLFWFNR